MGRCGQAGSVGGRSPYRAKEYVGGDTRGVGGKAPEARKG